MYEDLATKKAPWQFSKQATSKRQLGIGPMIAAVPMTNCFDALTDIEDNEILQNASIYENHENQQVLLPSALGNKEKSRKTVHRF